MSEPVHDAIGYLESIDASGNAPDGESQTQTFVKRRGDSLWFGTYTAARTPDGYTLTGMTREGTLVQRHFVRASLEAVNASIGALRESVVRNRTLAERARDMRVGRGNDSDDYSVQLARAEANANAAAAELGSAREAVDRLCASARKAREDANARIEVSGATLALNVSRMEAMTRAANAEQDEAVARHRLDVAVTAAASAGAELARLRRQVSGTLDRTRAPAAFVTSNDAIEH